MPVFNTDPEFLSESIDSIFQQTLAPDHVVIVDDGSTSDPTLEQLKTHVMYIEFHCFSFFFPYPPRTMFLPDVVCYLPIVSWLAHF